MIRWSAIAMMVLGVVHMLALGIDALNYVPGWARFDLWSLEHWRLLAQQSPAMVTSNAAFWMTIGSLAVPVFLLGYLVRDLDRRGIVIPVSVGWIFFIWQALCALIMQPSGFLVGGVIGLVLLVGLSRQHRAVSSRRAAGSATPGY